MLRRGVWNFGSDFVCMFIAFSFVLRVGAFCQECEYDRKAARYSLPLFLPNLFRSNDSSAAGGIE